MSHSLPRRFTFSSVFFCVNDCRLRKKNFALSLFQIECIPLIILDSSIIRCEKRHFFHQIECPTNLSINGEENEWWRRTPSDRYVRFEKVDQQHRLQASSFSVPLDRHMNDVSMKLKHGFTLWHGKKPNTMSTNWIRMLSSSKAKLKMCHARSKKSTKPFEQKCVNDELW